MDFSVDFMQKATTVLKEVCALKKYKAMPLALAIVTGVLMLPVALIGAVVTAVLYVLGYVFSIVVMPTQKLHKLLQSEGQKVQHATQFVIYGLSWAFVFSSYAVLTALLVVITILYSVFSILAYICTLGGFKFHLFPTDEDISVEVDGTYSILIPVIYIAGMVVLWLLLPLIRLLIEIGKYDLTVTFKSLLEMLKAQIQAAGIWRVLFSCVYSLIAFAPNPKKKAE